MKSLDRNAMIVIYDRLIQNSTPRFGISSHNFVEIKFISPVEPIDPRRSETPKRLLAGLRPGSSSAGRRPRGQVKEQLFQTIVFKK